MSWAISHFSSKVLRCHSVDAQSIGLNGFRFLSPSSRLGPCPFTTMGVLQLLECVSDVTPFLTHHPWLSSTFTFKPKLEP